MDPRGTIDGRVITESIPDDADETGKRGILRREMGRGADMAVLLTKHEPEAASLPCK